MKMTRSRFLFLLTILVGTSFSAAKKMARQETPPAPPFSAAEAAKLGDAHVAKKFPQFPDLYCSEILYDPGVDGDADIVPDPTIVWRLRYVIAKNPRKDVAGSPFPDWGWCLVFIHRDKSVTHTSEPKRNPPLPPP
ncbi:MAG: hypothetical protein WDN28_22015 [Chthoniobacter sp.]